MTLSKLRSALLKNLVLVAMVEGSIRAAVAFGWLTLPPADDTEEFDRAWSGANAPVAKRLYRPDRDLIYALRANADIVYDRTAVYPGKPAKYEVRTNEHGFRTPSFSEKKAPRVFRVACLGDSSTFGFNVEDADAYPAVLARRLEALQPGRFEVLNLGVPGYSSRQGLELIRQKVLRYDPDLVTVGFGTNDRFWRRPLSDNALITLNQSPAGATLMAIREGLDHVYAYRLLRRVLTFVMHRFVPGQLAKAASPRVSIDDVRDNITATQASLQPIGAALVVLNNDFFGTDAAEGIAAGAQASGAPFLDLHHLFVQKSRDRSLEIEGQHQLQPPQVPKGFALFRALALQPQRGVFIDASPLFLPTPTRAAMHDDGTQGDQIAGDGIWSAYVENNHGRPILYHYSVQTPKGVVKEYVEPTMGGMERLQTIPDSGAASIDVLGQYYLHSDASHPDEDGHALIAEQLVPVVLAAERAKATRGQGTP